MVKRPLIILGTGFGALIVGALILVFPFYAVMGFAASILATVLIGFLLQPESEYALPFIGGVTDKQALLIFDKEEIGADYPQVLIFRIRLCRLWLLAVVAGTSLGFLIVAPHTYFREIRDITLHRSIMVAVDVGIALFIFAAAWLRERWILVKSTYRLGIVYQWVEGFCAYEFVGLDGIWAGGSYKWYPWYLARLSNITPVLVSTRNAERHMPATACTFHQFELIERRHWPASGEVADRRA